MYRLTRVAQPCRHAVDRQVDAAMDTLIGLRFRGQGAVALDQFHLQVVERIDVGNAVLDRARQQRVVYQPFFATLLSNMDMVLAKTDLAIASRYADLVQDKELRDRIFKRITEEHANTLTILQDITGASERLTGNPLLARSIQNRIAYLDPLNHLQVELIKRHRALTVDPAKATDERVHRGIHLSINGVAAGLRNTG